MIFGIGTDIVTVARIEAASARHGAAFAKRILSVQEFDEYASQAHPARFLSKRFAAKEAFAKATGYGLRHPVSLHRMTVSHDELGKPIFLFDAELSAYLQRLGIKRHHLSISDERDTAVAFVILEGMD
ncbi:holo-ACP synthase [Sideroxydans sp. CL21]|jgi:holo-[acyl-carrier protein] synthase|uniref:holo-ACP synthase n=1 Tax=Sideroxydans sp. CL21 TaxID=2600596 RepID=UPI0012A934FD|nr:holo-ACP synthase [Sideroxydans sp. CL21]VVC84207.1 Holo-[acyl-carrier-protein] synthase (EC 2.7.8.7) [Sideroxydans sp. CL21]